jgi:hypothetical protein
MIPSQQGLSARFPQSRRGKMRSLNQLIGISHKPQRFLCASSALPLRLSGEKTPVMITSSDFSKSVAE